MTPARESRFARAGNTKGLENIRDFAHLDVLIHTAGLFVIRRFRNKLHIHCRLPSISRSRKPLLEGANKTESLRLADLSDAKWTIS